MGWNMKRVSHFTIFFGKRSSYFCCILLFLDFDRIEFIDACYEIRFKTVYTSMNLKVSQANSHLEMILPKNQSILPFLVNSV